MVKRNSKALRLIRVCIEDDKYEEIAKRGIQSSDFTGDSKIVFKWVENYRATYDSLPSIELLEEETKVPLPVSCPLEFAFEAFLEHLLAKKVEERTKDIIADLQGGRIKAAAGKLTPLDFNRTPPNTFANSRKQRYEEYEARKAHGIEGIDIPWKTLSDTFQKWENSTLNVFLGMSSSGKTWLSAYIAAETMKLGKRVLFVSLENPLESIGRRLDSLFYKVPFEDMRKSQADLRIEKSWRDRLDDTIPGDIILVDESETPRVSDILALSNSVKPDLILIDGVYLLKGSGAVSNWEKHAQVLSDLQSAAKTGKPPWLCSSQLNPIKKKGISGYDLGYEARYAKEFMLNPATSFLLLQDEDDRIFKRAIIKVAKIREAGDTAGLRTEFKIHSNRVTMDFSEIQEDLEYDIEY